MAFNENDPITPESLEDAVTAAIGEARQQHSNLKISREKMIREHAEATGWDDETLGKVLGALNEVRAKEAESRARTGHPRLEEHPAYIAKEENGRRLAEGYEQLTGLPAQNIIPPDEVNTTSHYPRPDDVDNASHIR